MPILFLFLRFWFVEAPVNMLHYFGSLNNGFLQLFSLPLFIKTFFKPLKNEYRLGLIWFSIGAGMFIKSILIIFDVALLVLLVFFETLSIVVFVALPLIAILVLAIR